MQHATTSITHRTSSSGALFSAQDLPSPAAVYTRVSHSNTYTPKNKHSTSARAPFLSPNGFRYSLHPRTFLSCTDPLEHCLAFLKTAKPEPLTMNTRNRGEGRRTCSTPRQGASPFLQQPHRSPLRAASSTEIDPSRRRLGRQCVHEGNKPDTCRLNLPLPKSCCRLFLLWTIILF